LGVGLGSGAALMLLATGVLLYKKRRAQKQRQAAMPKTSSELTLTHLDPQHSSSSAALSTGQKTLGSNAASDPGVQNVNEEVTASIQGISSSPITAAEVAQDGVASGPARAEAETSASRTVEMTALMYAAMPGEQE